MVSIGDDIIAGIENLLAVNKRHEIDGIFLDVFTHTHAYNHFSALATHDAKKFTERMEVTEVKFDGSSMAYGILFKDRQRWLIFYLDFS